MMRSLKLFNRRCKIGKGRCIFSSFNIKSEMFCIVNTKAQILSFSSAHVNPNTVVMPDIGCVGHAMHQLASDLFHFHKRRDLNKQYNLLITDLYKVNTIVDSFIKTSISLNISLPIDKEKFPKADRQLRHELNKLIYCITAQVMKFEQLSVIKEYHSLVHTILMKITTHPVLSKYVNSVSSGKISALPDFDTEKGLYTDLYTKTLQHSLPLPSKGRKLDEFKEIFHSYEKVIQNMNIEKLNTNDSNILNESIQKHLATLLPPADFTVKRQMWVQKFQRKLFPTKPTATFPKCPTIDWKDPQLKVFGSSANGFGTESADLDMSLVLPKEGLSPEKKADICIELNRVLNYFKMEKTYFRKTARIPVVMFTDFATKMNCDIAIGNTLAVHNTHMLHTYCNIDPRVRDLAFIIKHWAKKRDINSPSLHTLSSYGYILCLLHFLQNRPTPLIPNLQLLPPTWTGGNIHSSVPAGNTSTITLTATSSADTVEITLSECDKSTEVITELDETGKYNVYFYNPGDDSVKKEYLKSFASQNTESTATLLLEFFRYFAVDFNYLRDVVSIRKASQLKSDKRIEFSVWHDSERLSIEDPFETHYDVAHVISHQSMFKIHSEFMRAQILASRIGQDVNSKQVEVPVALHSEYLPSMKVTAENYIDILCTPVKY